VAEKPLSIDELLELASGGAKITTEKRQTILANITHPEPKPTEIANFDELIARIGGYDELVTKLSEMTEATQALVKSNESMASAMSEAAKTEAIKAQAQLEVLATLQTLIKQKNVPKVHDQLKSVLSELKGASGRPTFIGLTVSRNKQTGFIDELIPKYKASG